MTGFRTIAVLGALAACAYGASPMVTAAGAPTSVPRAAATAAPLATSGGNLLLNGSAEKGTTSVQSWLSASSGSYAGWDRAQYHGGRHSLRLTDTKPGMYLDWRQTVPGSPSGLYRLTGWIKTSGLTISGGNAAWLRLNNESTAMVVGKSWTYVSVIAPASSNGDLLVRPTLAAKGTAWYDDLQLTPVLPSPQHPSWKFLVLIYQTTDTWITRDGAPHHVVGTLTKDEQSLLATKARTFVRTDIPGLSSGNQVPTVAVRSPSVLTGLVDDGLGGWWPSPEMTARDRDPAFDAVIAIWQYHVHDITADQDLDLAGAGGLTAWRGTGQTYATIIAHPAYIYGARNVFKHEFGHSLLFFYEAAGQTPQPSVTNHAGPTDYVHCPTGTPYVWLDEELNNPIPNSIYNNDSGLTHDYYSGTVALPAEPTRCLGVGPAAWAMGGPVTRTLPSLAESVRATRANVWDSRNVNALAPSDANRLAALLSTVAEQLSAGSASQARNGLAGYVAAVRKLVSQHRLPTWDGQVLVDTANVLARQLPGASSVATPPMLLTGNAPARTAIP